MTIKAIIARESTSTSIIDITITKTLLASASNNVIIITANVTACPGSERKLKIEFSSGKCVKLFEGKLAQLGSFTFGSRIDNRK